MIPFNIPPLTGTEIDLVVEAINSHKICGDGGFTQKCNQWFEEHTAAPKVLLTTSCTHALETVSYTHLVMPQDIRRQKHSKYSAQHQQRQQR